MMRLLIAVVAMVAVSASADVNLTQINNNEVADAAEVMGNFNALNGAIPLVWSDIDVTPSGIGVIETNPFRVVNALEVIAPAEGVLVVSGSVYASNFGLLPGFFAVDVLINGVSAGTNDGEINGAPFVAAAGVPAFSGTIAGPHATQIAYTIAEPIGAGVHSVEQTLEALGEFGVSLDPAAVNYFYNRNMLTVQYYPSTQASWQPTSQPVLREAPAQRNSLGQ